MYPDPGSNRDGLPHWCLRPARLPIPPSGLNCGCKDTVFFLMRQTFYKKVAHAAYSEKTIFSTLTWPITTSQKGVEAMRIGRYQHHTAWHPYRQKQKNDAAKGKRHQTVGEISKLNGWKQKAQRMKTENRTDENKRQNEWKQKTQWLKTRCLAYEIFWQPCQILAYLQPNEWLVENRRFFYLSIFQLLTSHRRIGALAKAML